MIRVQWSEWEGGLFHRVTKWNTGTCYGFLARQGYNFCVLVKDGDLSFVVVDMNNVRILPNQ